MTTDGSTASADAAGARGDVRERSIPRSSDPPVPRCCPGDTRPGTSQCSGSTRLRDSTERASYELMVTAESTFEIARHSAATDDSRRTAARTSASPFRSPPLALERIALGLPALPRHRTPVFAHAGAVALATTSARVMVQHARRLGEDAAARSPILRRCSPSEVRMNDRASVETAIATASREAHGVDRSTASRWLERLETDGYLAGRCLTAASPSVTGCGAAPARAAPATATPPTRSTSIPRRDRKRLWKTCATLAEARAWQVDTKQALRKGTLRAPIADHAPRGGRGVARVPAPG